MGYGPRKVGSYSQEFPIHEPGMPEVCFTIRAENGVVFETEHPEKIRVNNQSVFSTTLEEGDEIQMGDSVLEVSFIHK